MATQRLDMPTYRVPRSDGLDGGTKRLALTAAGLGGALVLVLGLWGTSSHRSGEIPVIRAEPGPYRVKPTDPGGMKLDAAEEDMLGSSGTGKADKLAPPPELPEPSALRTKQSEPTTISTPAASPAPTANPAQPESIPAQPSRPTAASSSATAAQPTKPAVSAPAPATATPGRPAAAAPASPRAAAEPAGNAEVQLAAVGSEADAQKEWARLAHKAPELFNSRKPLVTRFDRDGKTFWRVRTGFADIAEATRFCEQARAKGLACSIAAF